VPGLSTDDKKENRNEFSQELFANANGNENILKNNIKGDGALVNEYNVETNAIVEVDGERVSWNEQARRNRSKIKVMLIVFLGWKSIGYYENVPRCQMVNKQMYQEVLARLRNAVRKKRSEL
jgi:hypothetical protein